MTDNALKIIKDELDRIDSSNEEKFNDRDANGNGLEDYYIAEKDKDMLYEALSVAVESIERLQQPCTRTDYTVGQLDKVVCEIANEALNTIANILSGGKDGNFE